MINNLPRTSEKMTQMLRDKIKQGEKCRFMASETNTLLESAQLEIKDKILNLMGKSNSSLEKQCLKLIIDSIF